MTAKEASAVQERARALFERRFGSTPDGVLSAPGRVNLIGDHTDYTGGLVLPAALRLETALAFKRREDAVVRAVSERAKSEARFGVGEAGVEGWAAYLAGVAWALGQAGFVPSGVDLAVASEVPSGSGLSSSAALEVAAARAWRKLGSLALDDTALALLCQKAENLYVGVPCGVMDQFAASVPAAGQAILLDCQDLSWRVLTVPPSWAFVVVNSGASRKLAGSAYAARVRECQEIAETLALGSLRALEPRHLEALEGDYKARARHVLSENRRVDEAAAALEEDAPARFGEAMCASHRSLKDDYQVSSGALDQLVEVALGFAGCYGSRLTGAGFGGCTVSLLARDGVEAFTAHLAARAPEATVVAVV